MSLFVWFSFCLFPESVWAKGSSHHHIFSSSHLLIFTSSSSHLLVLTSSHLPIFWSSHIHIFLSSHLHIFLSSHLHLHILALLLSSSLALLPSCSLALFSLLLFYVSLKARGSANEAPRNATLSHEMSFDHPKLQPNCNFEASGATLLHVLCASLVLRSRTGKYFVLGSTLLVVRSSTGKYFVPAVTYEVVLGSTLCKPSTAGEYFVQAFEVYWEVLSQTMEKEVLLGSTLCKLCSAK